MYQNETTKQQLLEEREAYLEMMYERLKEFLDAMHYEGFTEKLPQSHIEFYMEQYIHCI